MRRPVPLGLLAFRCSIGESVTDEVGSGESLMRRGKSVTIWRIHQELSKT